MYECIEQNIIICVKLVAMNDIEDNIGTQMLQASKITVQYVLFWKLTKSI